jgi:GNAT superfamily N-acetyltransferase
VSDIEIRAARLDELATVEALLSGASTWLASRGIDQWQYPPRRDRITQALQRGECFLAVRDGEAIATVQVDAFADPEFWDAADGPEAALYVHRMAVSRKAAGENVGAVLLDWAAERAADAGKSWLRLDAWKDNPGLHRYYERVGFDLVRIVDLPHRRSGALYQRRIDAARDIST